MSSDLPLHPAVVHLPIGLTVVLPLLTAGLWFFFSKKLISKSVLMLLLLFQFLLCGFSYLSIQTGEDEKEKVVQIVGKEALETHEEKAEFFYTWTLVVAFITLALLTSLPSKHLSWGFLTILILQVISIYLVFDVGRAGGRMVYELGAPRAYQKPF